MRRSSPEAEVVPADTTVRKHGLPCAVFWEGVRRRPNVILYDDNQSMIAVARAGKTSGKNPWH